MKTICVAGALLSSISVAAASDEYYVVRDLSTKQCSIVESPPTSTEVALVENGSVYFERSEAERVMATLCRVSEPVAAGDKARPVQAQAPHIKKPKSHVGATKPPAGSPAKTQHVDNRNPLSSLFSLSR